MHIRRSGRTLGPMRDRAPAPKVGARKGLVQAGAVIRVPAKLIAGALWTVCVWREGAGHAIPGKPSRTG